MTRKFGWFESPVFNWVGVTVSLVMFILYIQQLIGPNQSPSTPYVTATWGVIFVTWLATAVYKSWFKKS